MKIFIEETYHGIWKDEKRPLIPTHDVDGVIVDKLEKDWSKEDK